TDEQSIRNRLDLKTALGIQLKGDYKYSDRMASLYKTQPLSFNPAFAGSPPGGPQEAWEVTGTTVMTRGVPIEFNLLRRFDEAARKRHDASGSIEMLKSERTNFSANYRYVADEYD